MYLFLFNYLKPTKEGYTSLWIPAKNSQEAIEKLKNKNLNVFFKVVSVSKPLSKDWS